MGQRVNRRGAELAPPQTPVEFVRFCWTALTSMRTALVLLFALAFAAIPGSLGPRILPQRPNNPVLVNDFIAANPTLGAVFDRLGLFDVYGSPWFAAIYLLLMVSLVGCIVPRMAVYARAVRAMPSGVPKVMTQLTGYRAAQTDASASDLLDAGEGWLVGRRYRVRRHGGELSGERGYLRELGNLAFHLSVLGVLAGVAVTQLWGYKGSVIVPEGGAFSNTLSQYDDFAAGALFSGELPAFTVWVDRFDVAFERGSVQRGAARQFLIHARVASASGQPSERLVEVNSPIEFGGTKVNLIGHGYAPLVTVTDAAGAVAFAGPVVFLPQDGNFTSTGVIKAPDARPQRLAFDSFFVPSQSEAPGVGPRSTFPDADNPRLWGTVWRGEPRVETGASENVYVLDKTGLNQVVDGDENASFRLKVGETYSIPGGGSVRFDGFKRWTKLQISANPGLPLVYGSVLLACLGLALSMFVRPRRLFVRVTDADGVRLVETGGLDKVDGRAGLDAEVAALAGSLAAPDGFAELRASRPGYTLGEATEPRRNDTTSARPVDADPASPAHTDKEHA